MAQKIDGVIEAVRYKNGQIFSVRVYERRGFTFSDRVLLDRKTLLERLQKGLKFFAGSRKEYMASDFDLGQAVRAVKREERDVIVTNDSATHDELEGVPVF